MKYSVLIFLLLTVSFGLFSQEVNESPGETNYSKFDGFMSVSLRFIFPFPEIDLLAFCDYEIGIGYNIIPKYYSIGIACDAAVGIDWFSVFSKDKNVESGDIGTKYTQFGFSFGSRIYNSIKILDFEIIPFFGSDFLFVLLPMPYVGMNVAYKGFGIEYAFYLPELNTIPARHQLSLKYSANY